MLFYADEKDFLEKKIHKYLKNYYDIGNNTKSEGDVYYYLDGEVTVENHGWQEIKDMQQIIDETALLTKHIIGCIRRIGEIGIYKK